LNVFLPAAAIFSFSSPVLIIVAFDVFDPYLQVEQAVIQ